MNRQSVLISKKTFLVLILLIFLLGFALRAVEILSGDFVFLFDQGRDYLDVRKIVVEHKLTLIGPHTGIGGVFTGPGWYYLLAIPFILWKGHPFGGQVFMLLGGLLALILAYWVNRKIFNPWVGLIAFFLTAVSRPIFSHATMVWSPHLIPPLVLLSFYFLYGYFQTRKGVFLLITYFLFALMYHFELAVMAACLVYTSFFLLAVDRKTKLKTYFCCLLALILGFGPAILFEARHRFIQTKSFFDFFFGQGGTGKFFHLNRAVQLDHLKSFWSNLVSTFNLPQPAMNIFLIVTLMMIIWLWRQNFLNKAQRKLFLYFLFFPFVTFSFYLFFPNAVWQWYLTHLYFVYMSIASIVIYFSVKQLKILRIIYFVFIILMVFSSLKTLRNRYKYDFIDPRGTVGFKSKLEAIDYIYQDAKGEEFNVLVFTPPIYDYPYRYLLSWYGEKKYGFVPEDRKEGLLYLWIEPDPTKPWTYQGWLETVVREGKIVKEEKLPSGFIIQKRYVEER